MSGIACAGHWVLDFVKIIDYWPNRAELSNIKTHHISNGGAPFNVLADLSNLRVDIPTYGIGCLGNDDFNLLHVLKICLKKRINTEFITILNNEFTSFTDVMTEEKTGTRTMFHYRGANRKFSENNVPIEKLKELDIKLFYLGHLLLLDALEKKDSRFKIKAAKLLHDVQQAGMETAVDVATESGDRYDEIVVPCLPYIDHFIINELEAEKTAKIEVRNKKGVLQLDKLKKAAKKLLDLGVQKNVVIHMPEGGLWMKKDKTGEWYPSYRIPSEKFAATCGAGDAYCSGVLVGLHEKWSIEDTLHLATATSALSITSTDNSDGIKPLKETLKIADSFGRKEGIIKF